MQKRRISPGHFSGIVRACIVVMTIACGSFVQAQSAAGRGKEVAAEVQQRVEPKRSENPTRGGEQPKPDFEEIRRQKREMRDSVQTQPAIAIRITSGDDKKIVQAALREERARIREELKANGSTQRQRNEELRQEASRRIAEAKERARDARPRD